MLANKIQWKTVDDSSAASRARRNGDDEQMVSLSLQRIRVFQLDFEVEQPTAQVLTY